MYFRRSVLACTCILSRRPTCCSEICSAVRIAFPLAPLMSPLEARNVVRSFRRFLARHHLREVRLHDLRHTHASLLLLAGEHPKVVQERLRHSSIRITLDAYSHLIPSMQRDAARRFEALLS